MMISKPCFLCTAPIEGDDLNAFGLAGLAHVRAEHADAPGRGVTAIEAYPHHIEVPDGVRFRGDRSLFDRTGFAEIERREVDVVVSRPVPSPS
jgi:hypothetical protein